MGCAGDGEGQDLPGFWSSARHSYIVLLVCCSSGQTEHFHFWSPSVRIHQAAGFLFCIGFTLGFCSLSSF